MIFERSLQRELAYTAGAVFMVLLTIVLTTMMIRIVGFAASGEIDPRDVLVLIGLTVIGYLAIMLVATLFVSILFVLTRWYQRLRDGRVAVFGREPRRRFIKPIGIFATPIIMLIMFFVFVGWPWSNQQSKLIRARFQQRDEVSLLAPGQFRESAGEPPRVLHREDVARPGARGKRVRDEHGRRQGQRGRVEERAHRNA